MIPYRIQQPAFRVPFQLEAESEERVVTITVV